MGQIYYVLSVLIITFIIYSFVKILRPKEDYKKLKPKLPGNGYKLFYTDEKVAEHKHDVIYSKLLHSKKYDISGKPDYIFIKKNNNMLLPVELKSGTIGNLLEPRQGDLMQLCAYFLIIEDVYGTRPSKGRIIYKDTMFIVKNTKKLRRRIKSVLEDMREMLVTGEQEANSSFVTCKHCVCRDTVCEYCE